MQASDIRSYEPGNTVVFHRDVFGCRVNDVCIVMGHDDGRVVLAQADRESRFRPSGNAAHYLGLYDTERIELRAGDRIRWTRNRKAPPARFSHPQAPDLVNGGEAEIVEIGYKRVRLRDGEREFVLSLTDPQLRHLDHAWCSTVHAAQGRTARAAIAVLDAGGWVDRELFHVELSRVSEAFLLLTDDREALVERLEAHEGSEDGALEALGIDLSEPPVVEPEEFAALAADWRALLQEGEETNTVPFFLTGCLNHHPGAWSDVHAGIRELAAALGRDTTSLHHRQPELFLDPITRPVPDSQQAKDADASYRLLRDQWHRHVALAEASSRPKPAISKLGTRPAIAGTIE